MHESTNKFPLKSEKTRNFKAETDLNPAYDIPYSQRFLHPKKAHPNQFLRDIAY
jgi:hypothetical protein